MIEFKQIKENCLYVKDLDKTQLFYQEVLGLPLISKVAGRHIFFRAGSSVLLCFLPEVTQHETNLPPHFAFGKQHLAFEVGKEAYQSCREKIIQLGIPIIHEQAWGQGKWSFYFEDPDRHVVEVVPDDLWD